MNFLLLIAHGSRRQGANEEILRLGERVSALAGNEFDAVEVAFLELAQPDIRSGVARCAERGAKRVVVVPYFLAGGNHVHRDIPEEIESCRAEFTQLSIEIGNYPGASERMAQLVLDCSEQAG